MTLDEFVAALQKAADTRDLNKALIDSFDALGVSAVYGQELPYGASLPNMDQTPMISTYPQSAKDAYADCKENGDPFFAAAMANGAPVHYLHLQERFSWSDQQKILFTKMEEAGLKDGVATPVIVKPGVAAYFSAAYTEEQPDLTNGDLRRMHILFSEYYFRYREVTAREKALLSKRERQILVGIVAGKSNMELSNELKLSKGTIDTYVQRCFEKLNVRSRLEAALKYFSLGLHLAEPPN